MGCLSVESRKKYLVIADDLSGAAEIAGIAFKFGLSTIIQTELNLETKAQLIVFCANTREKNEEEARYITANMARSIRSRGDIQLIFKKIDSVYRGHILAENNVLMNILGMKRSLLLAANPSLGRKIRQGIYYISDKKLSDTHFRNDPYFPRYSSHLPTLLGPEVQYIQREEKFPSEGILLTDIESIEDFRQYLTKVEVEKDLVCGGGDAFKALLMKLQKNSEREIRHKWEPSDFEIFVNGSTHKLQAELSALQKIKISPFLHEEEIPVDLVQQIIHTINSNQRVCICVGQIKSVKNIEDLKKRIEIFFGNLIALILQNYRMPITLYLTGGATAYAVVSALKSSNLIVVSELSRGVVELISTEHNCRIIIKPGSYLWPDYIFTYHNQKK